jgi:hypothetical protein
VKGTLAALLLLFCAAAARAEDFGLETREFSSRNNHFRLAVGYSGRGGLGRARLELSGAAGKKISVFEAERPPFAVTISDDGRRLFFFCGAWGQMVTIYTLNVHEASGALLASHQVEMLGPAGEDFSADHSIYALGADHGSAWSILVLNTEDGKLLWRKKFKQRLAGLKLSGSGKRLLAVFMPGKNKRRAVVFDRSGKELWSREIATGNNLSPRVFSGDGSAFELWEDRMVYDEKTGFWRNKTMKKRSFRFTRDGVVEAGAREVKEEME